MFFFRRKTPKLAGSVIVDPLRHGTFGKKRQLFSRRFGRAPPSSPALLRNTTAHFSGLPNSTFLIHRFFLKKFFCGLRLTGPWIKRRPVGTFADIPTRLPTQANSGEPRRMGRPGSEPGNNSVCVGLGSSGSDFIINSRTRKPFPAFLAS